jgi:exopolyphosphatase / guanosine-5'-triphosphate,3'-diphosphate pyrophosphatase
VTRVAAVDCGTNSFRLLIADAGSSGALEVVERRTTITRLGRGVDATRSLDPAVVARCIATLQSYGDAIGESGCEIIRITATSAARDAVNFDELRVPAMIAIGVEPEVISGEEEARLSFLGATAGLDRAGGPYLVIDIGGGSTELVLGHAGEAPSAYVSADMGCVRVTEKFFSNDPPEAIELAEALSFVDDHLGEVEARVPAREASRLVGVAGTVTTLAALALGLDRYDPRRTHHHVLSRRNAEALFRRLASETIQERREDPALEPERADVIVAGTLILLAVLRRWELSGVLVSESDILDGIALSLVS